VVPAFVGKPHALARFSPRPDNVKDKARAFEIPPSNAGIPEAKIPISTRIVELLGTDYVFVQIQYRYSMPLRGGARIFYSGGEE